MSSLTHFESFVFVALRLHSLRCDVHVGHTAFVFLTNSVVKENAGLRNRHCSCVGAFCFGRLIWTWSSDIVHVTTALLARYFLYVPSPDTKEYDEINCHVWSSHCSNCEGYCLLGYDFADFVKRSSCFQRVGIIIFLENFSIGLRPSRCHIL
jgi:hypothetical protein